MNYPSRSSKCGKLQKKGTNYEGEGHDCMTDGRTRNVTVLIFEALTDVLARCWRR